MLILLACTLFLSAFLLFCSEPMVGKMVLPILGGAASVWTTCVLFFQLMLLAGYVYTHLLGKLKRVQQQILVHLPLMLLAIAFLPIHFSHGSGNPSEAPVSWLLQHLMISVGLPLSRTWVPITLGSPPNCWCHVASEITATAAPG